MDLNKLKTFYHVALEGSYQKASIQLGIKPSYISKQITSLEEDFKIKFFKRSHRSVVLTEKGEEFLKSVQIIMQQIGKIETISNNASKKEEDNIIRIVTTTGFTSLWIVQRLKKFIKKYPNYKLRILTIDDKIDLSNHFADIAILPKIDPNASVTQKKLYTCHSRLFASKDYLEEFGVPATASDLDQHLLISYYHNKTGHQGDLDWHLRLGLENKPPRIPYLVINSAIAQFEAAIQGIGIFAIGQEFPCARDNRLIKVLPNEGMDIPIYLATHIDKIHLHKVELITQFLADVALEDYQENIVN